MTDKERKRLEKIVDGSGFPLQLKLEEIYDDTQGWMVEGQELYWEIENHSGFIDTIYGNNNLTRKIITEVKKTSGGEWLFMADKKSGKKGGRMVTLWQGPGGTKDQSLEWRDSNFGYVKEKSAFCIVSGQDERNPMLERLCTQLLMATEAFAKKQFKNRDKNSTLRPVTYYPVIVTNSPLYLCLYDSSKVDLDSGTIDGDKQFKEVKSIIFQKPFWSSIESVNHNNYSSQFELNVAQDRSVLIVHSTEFFNFLNKIDR